MPDVKTYRNEQIAVIWEPERCIHSGNCVRGLGSVFNPRDRPWIHIDAASADAIAATILHCPTGALHFERTDGGPGEEASAPTTVTLTPDGPLYLRGDIEVRDARSEVVRRDTRMALCRCGASRNKPFCDNSHRLTGFVDPGIVE